MLAKVGNLPEPGDSGMVEENRSALALVGPDKMSAEKFLDHLGMESAKIGRLSEFAK